MGDLGFRRAVDRPGDETLRSTRSSTAKLDRTSFDGIRSF